MKRYIITGAPSTGKTTLINSLQKNGHTVFEEVSRRIIISEQQKNSNKTPWENVSGFTKLVHQQTIKELHTPILQHAFVDRGLADNIAYLQLKKQPVSDDFLDFDYQSFYHNTVFFCPLWKEIYTQDEQRLQSFEEAKQLQNLLLNTYNDLGFSILEIPKTTVHKRLHFINTSLK
ncbi:AAA family ATPase [uncultured Tenacibaculum sp.]|uniref:AAA family ATPase n=1 Tax=uncultured Tenacibaculum sp. TaxID=174713 RepID=UPI00261D9DFF|nr:AAA family ATPase [uncultured Tenacibaculum sp.]